MENTIYFIRIKNDTNGNPRYVCHFLNLLTANEKDNREIGILDRYAVAITRANSIGGRKFNNKQYGGGIVFKSYSLDELITCINEVTGRNFTNYTCK